MRSQRIPSKIPARLPSGVSVRHSAKCPAQSDADAKCMCELPFRAFVYVKAGGGLKGEKQWRRFATIREAEAWREEERTKQRKGQPIRRTKVALRDAAEEWLDGAEAGSIRGRGDRPYKPSVVRSYRVSLDKYVLPELGSARLTDITHADLVRHVERLRERRPAPSSSTIRNAINAVRVIYRRAYSLGEVGSNPTTGLDLPNGVGHRTRAATAEEAGELLDALPDDLRPLYATAFYAGLRRGELRGLRWEDVDLAAGVIHVRRSWDDKAGEVAPKSESGTRLVPLLAILRDDLVAEKIRTGGESRHFVFPGRENSQPFTPTNVSRKAAGAWAAANEQRTAEAADRGEVAQLLDPIGLHECRHTFVSLCWDAGYPLERIGRYVGHSSAYMTDRYAHLLKGHEADFARGMDEYLARADSRSRIEQLDGEDEA